MSTQPALDTRPRVLVHYAQTIDGRIAAPDGSSHWISCPESLHFAHQLRAAHDAVLVGLGTLLQDDPRLTVRHVDGPDPLKVLLDSRLRVPLTASILRETPDRTLILTTPGADARAAARLEELGVRVLVTQADLLQQVALGPALSLLAAEGVRSVMVEGGSRVITGLLRARLVDRLVICVAPRLLGRGVEAVGDIGCASLAEALPLENVEVRRLGTDLIVSGDLARDH